jgi:hypothetical protein
MSLEHTLKSNPDCDRLPVILPNFYEKIFSSWFSFKRKPKNIDENKREVIWYNQYILVGNNYVFRKKLYNNGMVFIADILDDDNSLVTYDYIISNFGNHISRYDYTCLLHAIPNEWKHILKNIQRTPNFDPNLETVFLLLKEPIPTMSITSKKVYQSLLFDSIEIPNCIRKWYDKFDWILTNNEWKQIFCLSRTLTSDTKLIEFQFKIIHRCYAADSVVSNFDPSVSDLCLTCNTRNNIVHKFAYCNRVFIFWMEFDNFLEKLLTVPVNITIQQIILGIPNAVSFKINFLILHAKWFIHVSDKNKLVSFELFMTYLQQVISIERERIMLKQCQNNVLNDLRDINLILIENHNVPK